MLQRYYCWNTIHTWQTQALTCTPSFCMYKCTYWYSGRAHPSITSVIPIEPAKAKVTSLQQRRHSFSLVTIQNMSQYKENVHTSLVSQSVMLFCLHNTNIRTRIILWLHFSTVPLSPQIQWLTIETKKTLSKTYAVCWRSCMKKKRKIN